MKQGRHKIRIADLGRVVTGKTPPTKQPELYGTSYPFITPTDIGEDSRNIETARFISEQGRKKCSSGMLPPNAVCFTCIASIGKICMTSQLSLTNQQINSIIIDQIKNDPQYIFYLLRMETERIKSIASGVATPIINKTMFSEIEIDVLPLPTQRKIAAILSTYDDLIENNLRRIKILEEMAQNLYREWFVKFHFPDHEKTRFVDSPLGRIPDGWEVKMLGEILKLNYGKALKQEDRSGGAVPVYGSSGVVGYHDVSLAKGPGIVVGRKGNVGSIFWSSNDFYVIDTAYFVSSLLPLRFLFYDLQTKNFLNNDAAVPGLNRNQAYSLETVIPEKDILARFCEFADAFELQASILRSKNTTLRRTRDLLLPKLISGEVDVSEIGITVPKEEA